eukprot:TRINITY_DN2234_c0_g1_i1.p1 TRINITY_DN2234_c0_g1~~TRINITY_DN2234_c0_g1_i1.p1  ORF type:complete len:399 (-),score=28.80 TRINITY_DN2234_c0_g1_i1:642-1802(-)
MWPTHCLAPFIYCVQRTWYLPPDLVRSVALYVVDWGAQFYGATLEWLPGLPYGLTARGTLILFESQYLCVIAQEADSLCASIAVCDLHATPPPDLTWRVRRNFLPIQLPFQIDWAIIDDVIYVIQSDGIWAISDVSDFDNLTSSLVSKPAQVKNIPGEAQCVAFVPSVCPAAGVLYVIGRASMADDAGQFLVSICPESGNAKVLQGGECVPPFGTEAKLRTGSHLGIAAYDNTRQAAFQISQRRWVPLGTLAHDDASVDSRMLSIPSGLHCRLRHTRSEVVTVMLENSLHQWEAVRRFGMRGSMLDVVAEPRRRRVWVLFAHGTNNSTSDLDWLRLLAIQLPNRAEAVVKPVPVTVQPSASSRIAHTRARTWRQRKSDSARVNRRS